MKRHQFVDLGNLILSLSDAMDLANPSLSHHQQRTGFIVWELGKAAELPAERLERIFVAALLHDIGALSLEEKVALRNNQPVDDIDSHCTKGEILLGKVPWLKEAASLVRWHHREWQRWDQSIDEPLVFDAQLLFLADSLERLVDRDQYILHVSEGITATLNSRAGSHFHPEVVALFNEVAQREEFWLDLASPRLYSLLLEHGPFTARQISLNEMMPLAELFRNIIDFRCRFTSTHSSGVAAAALVLADIFGLADMELQMIQLAGNLHDIGKLAIPNSIIDKPAPLSVAEYAVIKSHPYHTYTVLGRIGGLQQVAEWAASHHEKLDGSGYPFRCRAEGLSTGARIMTVADIFTALAEDRPYRAGMSDQEIIRIMKSQADRQLLDQNIVRLLVENFAEIKQYVTLSQNITRDYYEGQFAFLDQG